MPDRIQKLKENRDRIEEEWVKRRIEKGKEVGKEPCLHASHRYVENHPELIYSSPHLHWDFGNCDGWLDDEFP